MTPELLQQIEAQGGIVDLSARAKFKFTGADRVRYLNGQVTNDIRQASGKETLYACVTDAKGKIVGDMFMHAADGSDALWGDAEAELRDILGPRLERYIVADDVELTDVTEEWQLWHVFGPCSASFLPDGKTIFKSNRLGFDGVDVWTASPPSLPAPALSAADFETLRILRGIPRYPHELKAETFPPEAGIEARAMSYTKGCYIGQEVLSRIRTTGKMPRQLVQWTSDTQPEPGDSVYSAADPGKIIGTITSAAWHPGLQRHHGLAFIKQGSAPALSKLPVGLGKHSIATAIEISAFVN